MTVFSGGSDAGRACLEHAQVDCHTDPSIIAGIAFGAFLLLIMMVGLVIHARVSSGGPSYHEMDSSATSDDPGIHAADAMGDDESLLLYQGGDGNENNESSQPTVW